MSPAGEPGDTIGGGSWNRLVRMTILYFIHHYFADSLCTHHLSLLIIRIR